VKDIGLTLLAEGKTIRIKAHGYSMFPRIKPGSLILIEPLNIKGMPRPGEIIAIKRENGLIVHRLSRIINKNGVTCYIARGDSNAYADNPVKIDKIAGRIVRAESTGENPVPADIRINIRPKYFINRIRVIGIILWRKIRF
jgi:signal peptidase I